MELLSNLAVTLKAPPTLVTAYQGHASNIPVVLGPQVPGQNNGIETLPGQTELAIARLMPVQLGARLRLVIPYIYAAPTSQQPPFPALESYRYRPVWRLRSTSGTRLAHNLPEPTANPLAQQGSGEVVAAWAATSDLTVPSAFPPPLPLDPLAPQLGLLLSAGGPSGNDAAGAGGTHPLPWWSVDIECEGDEFGLLVVPAAQAFGAPAVGTWDFAPGAANRGFGQVFGKVNGGVYDLGMGIAALVHTRSP